MIKPLDPRRRAGYNRGNEADNGTKRREKEDNGNRFFEEFVSKNKKKKRGIHHEKTYRDPACGGKRTRLCGE